MAISQNSNFTHESFTIQPFGIVSVGKWMNGSLRRVQFYNNLFLYSQLKSFEDNDASMVPFFQLDA